ncbi:YqaJ viral recombinase family protein [Actinomadura sp. 21ATH]|uniref:YqaJ viral recombinase family nuclease n=1 Tax=Actinomadura sp. 21ATH TaxID=1735444 RepID=UPI0035BF616B
MSLPYKVLLPASTDRGPWLAARRGGIGSSDVANILGVGGSSAQRVFYDKVGRLPLEDDAGEAALWGSLDEETTAREWARRNRSVGRRIGLIARKDAEWQMCTLDRLITECPMASGGRERCALEVKHRSAWLAGKWKRTVPDDVLAQVLWQMHVTGFDHLHVAVRIGGNDYRQLTVLRRDHRQLLDDAVTAVTNFWVGNVLARRVPPLTGDENVDRVLDLFEDLYPNRSGVKKLEGLEAVEANELLIEYELQRLIESRAKKAKGAAKARLIELLGDNEAAFLHDQDMPAYGWDSTTQDGTPLVKESIDMNRLADRHPDAYADCLRSKPQRRFNLAKFRRLTEGDLDRYTKEDDADVPR